MTTSDKIRATVRTYLAARDASRAHVDGYEAACRSVPCPAKGTTEDIAAYSARRVELATAAGYTAADGARLHREMIAARDAMLRVGHGALVRAGLGRADAWTQTDALVAAIVR